MPKNTPPRAIDERRASGAAFVGGGSGGGGGVTDHGLLSGLTDDDHLQYHTDERGDLRYVPLARTVTAGNGLTGGGALSANISLALASSAAGAGLAFASGVLSVNPGEGLEIETDNIGLASTVAGAGLAYSAGVLSVTPGEGLEIETDAIGLAASVAGAALSYNAGVLAVVPGEGLEIETDAIGLKASVAGDGLTYAAGVLGVGQGAGLTVSADAVALTTPGTLTVATANAAAGNHTHAVTSSADPDASASLLATTAQGLLTLRNGAFRQAAQSNAVFASGFAGSGWRVDYGLTTAGKASAEFDDLTIRGRMRVYELLIQQIRATNGSLFVSSSSKVVSVATAANPSWTVNGVQLTFNGSNATLAATIYTISTRVEADPGNGKAGDVDRTLYHGFLYGDLIRAQQVNWNGSSYDFVMQSNLEVTGVSSLYVYQAALVSGSAPAAGYDYVRLGNTVDTSRQGSVYITSDDSAAPFIDIVDGVRSLSDWNSAGVARVRVGKLTGISDAAFGGPLTGYGLYGNNVYLKGQMVVTGGSLGGLAAADVNANTTTIDGGKITANSITALQIAAGTISTTLLNFAPVLEGNIVARLNATTEGLKIAANLIRIDGTTTFSAGYDPTGKIAAGGAAADVNTNVTTISGGKITTGSITADKISVSDLSAFGATIGGWTIDSWRIYSGNIQLQNGADASIVTGTGADLGGGLSALAGITTGFAAGDVVMWAGKMHADKASAPFAVRLNGTTTFGIPDAAHPEYGAPVQADATGLFVLAPPEWKLAYGYKFRIGTSDASGLTLNADTGDTKLALWNNTSNDAVNAVISNVNTSIRIKNVATGAGRTSTIELAAHQIGGAGVASLGLESTTSTRRAVFTVDTADGLRVTNFKVWHEGNDGYGSGLIADDSGKLNGQAASYYATAAALSGYAPLASPAFAGTPTINNMQLNNNTQNTGAFFIDIGRWRNASNNTGIGRPATKYVRLFVYEDSTGKLRLAVSWPGTTERVSDIIYEPA